MSRSVSISVTFDANHNREEKVLYIVHSLIDYGWNFNYYGKISYLPLGDKNDFDWQNIASDKTKELFDILKEKEQAKEIVGVVLMWAESKIGIDMLSYPDETVSFLLQVNRKTILPKYNGITDVNWYLSKLLPPLVKAGFQINSVNWEEDM